MPSFAASASFSASWTSRTTAWLLIVAYCDVPAFGNAWPWDFRFTFAWLSSWSNCAFVTCFGPTTTTSVERSFAELPPPPPPQPATSIPRRRGRRRQRRFLGSARPASGRLARGQHSIHESQRPRQFLVSKGNFTLRGRVDGGVDAAPQLAQLARAEHDRTDGRSTPAEDEVVGAEARQLQLRLLDPEEVLDRLRERPVAVLGRDLELAQHVLVLDEREPAVQVDLQRLARDVARGDVGVDARVHADRPRGEPPLARELRNRLVQHLDVELEAEGCDVARLLGAEQVACAADLQVAHRDREARAELGVICERRESRLRLRRQLRRVRIEEVGVRRDVA